VTPPANITRLKQKSHGLRKHTIPLIGDSHTQSERLGSSYHCTGYVKPNANLNIITSNWILACEKP
jgi:hypothetical protein